MEDPKDPNGDLANVFTIDMCSEAVNNTDVCETTASSWEDEKEQVKPNASYTYEDLKSFGVNGVYRSSTIPIKVGGLILKCESEIANHSAGMIPPADLQSGVKVAWSDDPPLPLEDSMARQRKITGSSSAGKVNHANLSATVRRHQHRRHFRYGGLGRRHNCLRLVLCVLYYVGVSPYRPRSARQLPKAITHLLKVMHWIIVVTAIIESLSYLKLCWIAFRMEPKIQSVAEIGIAIISIATRIYTVKVFSGMKKRMDQLLIRFPESDSEDNDRETMSIKPPKAICYISIAVTLSVCMAISSAVFGYNSLENWSFESQQRRIAFDTSQFVSIWNPGNLKNVTDELYEEYMEKPFTTKSVALAMLGDMTNFMGDLYDHLTVDFWLGLSYQVYLWQLELQPLKEHWSVLTETKDFASVWDFYMACRIECDLIDEIFGHWMKLVHVANILKLSDFLLDVMDRNVSARRVACFLSLMKIAFAYCFCMLSANTNTMIHEKVINQADSNGFVEVNGVKMKIYALRMEMEHHPIGLGRGNFFVEETLLIKMVCAAWSVFALFADHSQGER